jgi:hypothetical protein
MFEDRMPYDLEVTEVISGLRRRIESGEYITIDIDF